MAVALKVGTNVDVDVDAEALAVVLTFADDELLVRAASSAEHSVIFFDLCAACKVDRCRSILQEKGLGGGGGMGLLADTLLADDVFNGHLSNFEQKRPSRRLCHVFWTGTAFNAKR